MLTDTQLEALNNITSYDLTNKLNGLSTEDLTTFTPVTLPTLTTAQLSSVTPIQLSGLNTGSYGVLSATGGVGAGYTLSNGTTNSINWQVPAYTTSAVGATIGGKGGLLSLKGDDADIVINGKSMSDWMAKVEERLSIMIPNPELEKEWDDLRKLGERYRKLEKKCKEKAETWKKLKAMAPPSVD